ncbi:hypothetical protein SJ05684_c30430 [Sinorhizobium sojae CCBAU 05684]|uniref:Uncharacterized protein n=1 Tax=Sinorhizobium sojae CCBAU 05684 TaxID=716928 RepID=A0A249PFI5_9HYPH|nr:hypothetical protein [Sinorhizobium sojae]ASY64467.1 hypothetical protein SJ05684_c30430 [Sinorhizobium sojae CCBAU 05684]
MKARIIQIVDGQWFTHEVDAENLIPFMEIRGYAFTRLNDNQHQREELRGQPKFAGINGPMWDGDAIRYECPEAYAQLSV